MIGGNYTVSNPISVNWTAGTGQIFGVGGYLDANSTFSGLITLTGTAATGNTFAITQVANTGTNALNITGGITATNGGNINFANVGNVNVSSVISNGGTAAVSVTQTGSGTTVLSGANTYTGLTTVSGGTLQLGNGSGTGGLSTNAGTGGLKVTGGSLLFNNSSNAVVGATTVATSMGGGTLGFSTSTAAGSQISLGALTLTANTTSVLSFSTINQSITFSSLLISNTSNTILNIYNYVAGDALYFTNTTSPSTATLNDIFFFSDTGVTPLGNAVEFGTMGQVIPGGVATPEPSTYITGICFLALLAFASRRTQLLAQLQSCLVR
jgi:autotransporter-associated beta strand protein